MIVLTPSQLALANSIFEERNQLKLLTFELDSLSSRQKKLIELQNTQIENWKRINDLNQELLNESYKENEQLLKHKSKLAWTVGSVCVCVGFVLGACVFAFN